MQLILCSYGTSLLNNGSYSNSVLFTLNFFLGTMMNIIWDSFLVFHNLEAFEG